MIAIPNMEKPKNAFSCSVKINPEERRCIYTGKVFDETLSLLIDRPCGDCPLIDIVPCKECKWWDNNDDANRCTHEDGGMWAKPNAFCSYGERANATQHTQRVEEGAVE